ncbi:hypothetical protein IG631_04209 [Alternaria alternata]|nr:hypothetical protein IG631_04209 [Alternaria alternata]
MLGKAFKTFGTSSYGWQRYQSRDESHRQYAVQHLQCTIEPFTARWVMVRGKAAQYGRNASGVRK